MRLQGRDLSYSIGGAHLVREASVEVRPGMITVVVGANGAGKSTLLRLLAGELEPNAGGVWLDGRPLHEWSLIERGRRRAVLPQHSTLGFGFTVFDVVLLGRTPHVRGFEGARDHRIAMKALSRVGGEHLAGRRYPTLSGGERQRVHLARVLAQVWDEPPNGARYLLLDEPLTSLDLARTHDVMDLLADLAAEGIGIVAVLHDLNLAARYADQILVVHRGRTLACGEPETVLTPAVIQTAFSLPAVVTVDPVHGEPLILAGNGRPRKRGRGASAAARRNSDSMEVPQ